MATDQDVLLTALISIGDLASTFVPFLSPIVAILRSVQDQIASVEGFKAVWGRLADRVAQLVIMINQYQALRDPFAKSNPLVDDSIASLETLATEILRYVTDLRNLSPLKRYLSRDKAKTRLNALSLHLSDVSERLTIALQLDTTLKLSHHETESHDEARDHEDMERLLETVISGQGNMIVKMDVMHHEMLETLQALERRLNDSDKAEKTKTDRIVAQMRDGLRRVSNHCGDVLELADWTITSYDVDIGEPFAQGTYGEVCLGTFIGNTKVAVKRLHGGKISETDRKELLNEALIWKGLNHPNVHSLLGVCLSAPSPFIISRFMPKGNLVDYVRATPTANIPLLLQEASKGLTYLHSRNIIHGDIKGINILIDDGGHPLVTDFGFAKIDRSMLSRGRSSIQNNKASGAAGTLRWMAPELFEGEALSKPADMFAFAITMFEAVSHGQLPYAHLTDQVIPYQVVGKKLRPYRPETCSDEMWLLMQLSWSEDPGSRPTFPEMERKLGLIVH
eukprot:jgi/Hompol1/2824/HPOL_006237-RA